MQPYKLKQIVRDLHFTGVSEHEYIAQRAEILAKHPNIAEEDIIWSMLNKQLQTIASHATSEVDLYQRQRRVYFLMWQFLLNEGKDASYLLKQMLYCDLMAANQSNLKMRAEILAKGCCPECEKRDGETMPLELAIANQPIPNSGCTRKTGCICTYGITAIRGENDRLIKKS